MLLHVLLHCSCSTWVGIFRYGMIAFDRKQIWDLTDANYRNTHLPQYLVHISTFAQNRQVQKSQKEMRDLRRYGPACLLTIATIVDGDRAEPMSSTLLLAVPHIALVRGVLFHTVSARGVLFHTVSAQDVLFHTVSARGVVFHTVSR